MFVSVMGFFARISDPKIGGTYMTLLNTVYNLGGNWPNTLVLGLVDDLTFATCSGGTQDSLSCNQKDKKEVCLLAFSLHGLSNLCIISSFDRRVIPAAEHVWLTWMDFTFK